MTDRELLELAAKADGYETEAYRSDGGLVVRDAANPYGFNWNPLTDDGDALRLAVELGIALDFFYSGSLEAPTYSFTRARRFEVEEREGQPDPFVATRRAIVRAAAEIGKGML